MPIIFMHPGLEQIDKPGHECSAESRMGDANLRVQNLMDQILHSPPKCPKCDYCAINNRAVCRAAPLEALDELNALSRIRRFDKDSVIIGQDDESVIVGNVVSGIVKVSNSFADGRQQIVGLLFPSDFFGRTFKKRSRFSYEAATDVTLCCVGRRDFENILVRYPEIEHELLLTTLDELDAMREWIALIHCRTTMQRVATFLFILSKRSPNLTCTERNGGGNPLITLPIGRRDIAAYLGTTPETLSRNIQALGRKKVIRIIDPKHFELLNEASLSHHAGEMQGKVEQNSEAMAFLP